MHLSCGERQEPPLVPLLPAFAALLLPACHLSMRPLPCLQGSVQADCTCTAEAMQASRSWLQDQCRLGPCRLIITQGYHPAWSVQDADQMSSLHRVQAILISWFRGAGSSPCWHF